MQKRILPFALTAITLFSLLTWNCTKLDTTDIGSDLLPVVDNINTFEQFLDITTTQGIFNNDSTLVSRSENFALGYIGVDPLVGKTTANMFMQVKPPFYPYSYGLSGDTLVAFDSVVLCLKYAGFWGDKTLPVNLEVREVNDLVFKDSVFKDKPVNYKPTFSNLLGTASVNIDNIDDTVKYKNGRDFSTGLIRIKLSNITWVSNLFNRDSIAANINNNAFYTDSAYRHFYNGLAVVATGGNALMYVNLADTSTKLEIHFKRKKVGGTVVDSTYSSFKLNTSTSGSAANYPISNAANNIERNRAGSAMATPNSNDLYLQTSPGTYVNLDIPGLSTISNRIIHRAEIIVEQIPDNLFYDSVFSAPNYLYIDLKDTTVATKWKPIYFDLNPNTSYDPDYKTSFFFYPQGDQVDFTYFGGYKRYKVDAFGNPINYYNFNISRYMQHLVTRKTPNYQIRLFAPFNIMYPQYSDFPVKYANNLALGRVKIGSGTNPNYKLRLRIIYSKL